MLRYTYRLTDKRTDKYTVMTLVELERLPRQGEHVTFNAQPSGAASQEGDKATVFMSGQRRQSTFMSDGK